MPIYSYKCANCGKKFDEFQKTIQEEIHLNCPACNSGEVEKIMSAHSVGKASGASQAPPCQTGGDCSSCCGFH